MNRAVLAIGECLSLSCVFLPVRVDCVCARVVAVSGESHDRQCAAADLRRHKYAATERGYYTSRERAWHNKCYKEDASLENSVAIQGNLTAYLTVCERRWDQLDSEAQAAFEQQVRWDREAGCQLKLAQCCI